MVTRRIRSEYMKKYKDPKWESYAKCYEELLKYRLTRRLLEQTHNPWFWSGSDTDSETGGRSPPAPGKNQEQAEPKEDRGDVELEECQGAKMDGTTVLVPRIPLQDEAQGAHSTAGPLQSAVETKVVEEERVGNKDSQRLTDKTTGGIIQSKPSKQSRQARRSHHVKPVAAQQSREDSQESRHPFALYGSGEKDADTAGRKTHNVCPVASTHQIHESALRAKTRRQVERQIHTQRSERRRAKSADVEKVRKVIQPEFNPWLTEYMRCFSARSR
ncbi:centriole, cilia and spindle-associated protein isoform X2 [Nelusetta ayraudi]|uniref:centriole, cilia and spindle-associated protein isoform X2 n=1 Tax=Nelusetta ayraudi TaxID=303726 RepID=UPI003F70BC8E